MLPPHRDNIFPQRLHCTATDPVCPTHGPDFLIIFPMKTNIRVNFRSANLQFFAKIPSLEQVSLYTPAKYLSDILDYYLNYIEMAC